MYNIAICSMFRDSEIWHGHTINQISRYFNQIDSQNYNPNQLRVFCVEGDSKDHTLQSLLNHKNLTKYEVSIFQKKNKHKNSSVSSTTSKDRIQGLSDIGNYLLSQVDTDWADLILWIESDIIIGNDFLQKILASYVNLYQKKESSTSGIVLSPIVSLNELFYDTWAYSILGVTLPSSKLNRLILKILKNKGVVEMSSIGTCALFSSSVLKNGIDFGQEGFRSLCKTARIKSYRIYCDTDIVISHPGSKCVENRWI